MNETPVSPDLNAEIPQAPKDNKKIIIAVVVAVVLCCCCVVAAGAGWYVWNNF
ncbi:MAG: hypothetical protein Fur002_11770 [Anaerolineales bacterium]